MRKKPLFFLLGILVAGTAGAVALQVNQGIPQQNSTVQTQKVNSESASPATQAGLRAFVDEDGNLTTPSPEERAKLAEEIAPAKKDAKKDQEIKLIDPDDPSKGHIVTTPHLRSFSKAQVGADGKVQMKCIKDHDHEEVHQ